MLVEGLSNQGGHIPKLFAKKKVASAPKIQIPKGSENMLPREKIWEIKL